MLGHAIMLRARSGTPCRMRYFDFGDSRFSSFLGGCSFRDSSFFGGSGSLLFSGGCTSYLSSVAPRVAQTSPQGVARIASALVRLAHWGSLVRQNCPWSAPEPEPYCSFAPRHDLCSPGHRNFS